MFINIINLGLPNKWDKLSKAGPCTIACRWDNSLENERSDLNNCTEVAANQRPRIGYQCFPSKRSQTQGLDIDGVESSNEFRSCFRSCALVLANVSPKVLDNSEKKDM